MEQALGTEVEDSAAGKGTVRPVLGEDRMFKKYICDSIKKFYMRRKLNPSEGGHKLNVLYNYNKISSLGLKEGDKVKLIQIFRLHSSQFTEHFVEYDSEHEFGNEFVKEGWWLFEIFLVKGNYLFTMIEPFRTTRCRYMLACLGEDFTIHYRKYTLLE